uniref:Prostaglandin E receptor 2 n=1 Tax=Laticauda laticaudata TaxID=8630 RepID=A0A8C5RGX2_LATLA
MDEAGRGSTRPTPLFDHKGQEASVPPPLGDGPAISAVMFAAGVVGNLAALVLLLLARRRRLARRERLAPFHVLLTALVLTDLLGTCLLSPVVLAAYGKQRKLIQLDRRVCDYFAFSMSFFSLATLSCLGAMALERSLAMAAPYLYERLLSGRPLALLLGALPALYGLAAAFCALPLMGFGSYKDYQPGTWCFIHMRPEGRAGVFALLYASVVLLLFLAVLLGNLVVMLSLCRMYLRRRAQSARRPFSMSEELDHLTCSELELENGAWPGLWLEEVCAEKQQEKKGSSLFSTWRPSGTWATSI